ncbi:MAG: phosphonate C-P lyase system protein PhnG [Pseudomonadota bacterium]
MRLTVQTFRQAPKKQERHQASAPQLVAERQSAMALLSRATTAELNDGLNKAQCDVTCEDLRKPDVGLVMARGRISGTGQPFNVGEVTVSRAAVRLPSGTTGFSYLIGRSPERARLAAIADAYWQIEDKRLAVETHLLKPVRLRIMAEQQKKREQAAATQVDFFTMVRGDD